MERNLGMTGLCQLFTKQRAAQKQLWNGTWERLGSANCSQYKEQHKNNYGMEPGNDVTSRGTVLAVGLTLRFILAECCHVRLHMLSAALSVVDLLPPLAVHQSLAQDLDFFQVYSSAREGEKRGRTIALRERERREGELRERVGLLNIYP